MLTIRSTARLGVPAAFVTLFLWATGSPATAQELPPGVTEGSTVEGITEYSLQNGLRFLLFPDQGKQQVTVNITYLVGSRHEGYGETGMAHLLEHLVFKGTPNHPDIPAELTEHGAFPNGTTWVDRTNYFETFPATDENLEWALDLEADRMVNSYIAGEDLESEMTVVRNEWESGENNPMGVLQKRVMSAAYDWHNYGNSTIGARADIENVPIDRLQAFYRKYYQPDNAILVVAGRFDRARALSLIADRFGSIPAPDRTGANQLFDTYTAEPAQDGERSVTLRRVGDVQLVTAAYHMPPGSHEQFAAVAVMTHVLSTQPAGRLYKALVEPGLAANTLAGTSQFREPGLLFAGAQVRVEDSLDDAAQTLLATLDDMAAGPPTQEEVDRAKTEFLSGMELQFNNPQGIALQLSEWASMGDWRLLFLHRDRIEQVTTEAVHRVAQAYLKPSNRTIGYFLPTDETPARAEIPAPPDVTALVAGYTGREAVAEGEAFEPTPANIDARTETFSLASGMEVAFLPKRNRGGAVTVTIQLRFGSEQALMGKAMAGSLAGSMLMRGTESRSRQEISDELDRLKAQGGLGSSATLANGSLTTVRENLPAVLRLAGEILREPAFDPTEFDLLVEQQLAGIEAQRSEPQALVAEALGRHLNPWPPDHPFYAPTFDEQIARLEAASVEDSRAFWGAFAGAQGGTMSVVGDFDPAEIRPIIDDIFGSWTAPESYMRIDRPYRDIEAVTEDIETPDKANAMMIAVLPFPMRDDDPDYPALVIANEILGGGFLNSRLATRIRQQEGLSYGVGSQFSAHPRDEQGQFITFAIFAPENGDRVVTAFQEEMARALESGFTAEEVEAAKRGFLDQAKNVRANDGTVAQMLAANLFWDRTMEFTAERESAIEALTPDRIISAVRRHFDPGKISIFRGGDFANKLVP
jgi:zinc protease